LIFALAKKPASGGLFHAWDKRRDGWLCEAQLPINCHADNNIHEKEAAGPFEPARRCGHHLHLSVN